MRNLHLFYFFTSFFIFFSAIKLSLAADTINAEGFIKDGNRLVSSKEIFELGFFSPGNSKKRYLGIWYKKSPETVVWVANRNNPIPDTNGVLSITDGNLVLLNGTKGIIWSSNVSSKVENPAAELLDCGNFVLRDRFGGSSNSYLWQSFDYPSDVLLPDMKLGWNLRTGLDRYLTSWTSAQDPSSGNFTLRFDIRVLPEIVIYDGSKKIVRTGPWNGVFFAGIPTQQPNSIFDQEIVHNQDDYSYNYGSTSDSVIMFVKLNQSGWIEWHVWNERKAKWTDNYSLPEDLCGIYGRCGANSVCSINDKTPNCECLQGFIPKSQNNQTSSNGCVRSSHVDCDSGDGFVKLDGIKLPDLIDVSLNESISFNDCQAECLKNCSCKACANSNLTRGGVGCLMWFGDLIDVRKLPENRGTQEIYIRVPASKQVTNSTDAGDKRNKVWIIVILTIFSTIVFLVLIITCMRKMLRRKESAEDLLLFDLGVNLDDDSEIIEVKSGGGRNEVKLPLFSFASVSAATDNFTDENKLGEGGFGSVYKGRLLKGDEIAVKRLSKKSGQGWEEFKNEALLIAKLQHKNLVRVLGCCIEQDEKILIYEYMPNKSLDIVLFDPMRCKSLDWRTRVRIIEGVAQGLLYLHEYSRLRIIHRDLKASNILLDKDMNPKISDFGMARIFGEHELQANTTRIVGTFGYMSPEYVIQGVFSNKSDVFSFGVLLLEIISGKKNSRFCQMNSLSLLDYAWDSWVNGRGLDLMDPILEGGACEDMLLRYINIALLCVQERAEYRPSMSDVVSMLSNESALLPSPEQPTFLQIRSSPMSKTFISDAGNSSVDEITITVSDALSVNDLLDQTVIV